MKYFDYLKFIVYIRQMHIFDQFSKINFPNKCWFFSRKCFKGHSQFGSFLFV